MKYLILNSCSATKAEQLDHLMELGLSEEEIENAYKSLQYQVPWLLAGSEHLRPSFILLECAEKNGSGSLSVKGESNHGTGKATYAGSVEATCPICLEHALDPISPCKVVQHKLCRRCLITLRKNGMNDACPLCRGKTTDAENLYVEAMQCFVQAELCSMGLSDTGRSNELYCQTVEKLKEVLTIDPRHAGAYYCLAMRHSKGQGGLAKSASKQVELMAQSAEFGSKDAQFNMGGVFSRGKHGYVQDKVQAAKWYKLAAEQGMPEAQHSLACLIQKAEGGFVRDGAQAARLFKLAAEQGYIYSQCEIGLLYELGEGIAKDEAEAVKMYMLSAIQGYDKAQYFLGETFHKGKCGLVKDDVEARHWFELSADQGFADAQHELGFFYAKGEGGLKRDLSIAKEWWQRAAEKGFVQSQGLLRDMARAESMRSMFGAFCMNSEPPRTSNHTNYMSQID
jgi:TPR repeat protein